MRVLFGLMQNSAAHSMCFLPLVLGDAHSFQRDEAYRAARAGREISDTWSRPPTPLHLDCLFPMSRRFRARGVLRLCHPHRKHPRDP